jgi:hypothetical protein
MLLTFSTSIVTKTRIEILHLADRVARELGSNLYQIVVGNPSSAIHCGMRFCGKTELGQVLPWVRPRQSAYKRSRVILESMSSSTRIIGGKSTRPNLASKNNAAGQPATAMIASA